jgi:hypothetical protein
MNALQRIWAWVTMAAREHWLPLLILFVPINWVVYSSDASNVVPLLPLPIVAFFVGLLLWPRHVWILWLGAVIMEWIVVGYMGKFNDPGGGETTASIMIEAFFWMFFGVLLPAWLGRLVANGIAPAEGNRKASA